MIHAPINDDWQHLNPFNSDLALANSSYAAFQRNKLVRLPDTEQKLPPLMEHVHETFRSRMLHPEFSCVGAKAAMHRDTYRFGMYGEMNTPGTTAGLARDVFTFAQEQMDLDEFFTTFVACFTGPQIADERSFEQLLWSQLQRLHALDRVHHTWDSSVASDPQDPHFAFSFAGRAFFIVGLSAVSSRWTRRFPWPTLIFNAHYQFDRLRERGKYTLMQQAIRKREQALQGNVNATLSDFGEISEARQYAGRIVEDGWQCPFSPQK